MCCVFTSSYFAVFLLFKDGGMVKMYECWYCFCNLLAPQIYIHFFLFPKDDETFDNTGTFLFVSTEINKHYYCIRMKNV